MAELTGVEINVPLSSNTNWNINFTGGVYQDDTFIKTIEPFLLTLNPSEYSEYNLGTAWNVMYNYINGDISLLQKGEETSCSTVNQVSVGGFILSANCQIKFIYPDDACVVYNRLFDTDYDTDFDSSDSTYDACANTYELNKDFNSDFSIDLSIDLSINL